MTARRMATLAIVAGAIAALLVVGAASGDGGDDSGGEGWLIGLFLIVAPLLCAAVTRSVASSTLLRPVGGTAAALCALAALVHVAVAVDERGTVGIVFGAAAVASAVLLFGAVAVGPERRAPRAGRPSPRLDDGEHEVEGPGEAVQGPPLDVITPLRDARHHAAKALLAWMAVAAIAAVAAPALLTVLGWPRVEQRLEARVVAIRELAGQSAVTFESRSGEQRLRWTRVLESHQWRVGDERVLFLDDEGRVHADQQFGLAGIPLFMPFSFVGMFGAFAARRLWGLVLACWDVSHGDDAPRLAYAAIIDDPAPRTWRPLVAVWERDPTAERRLAKPDAVYRADDETGEELQCPASSVVVRRAWVDTGTWDQSKPRWIGVEHGVVVPHRRALLGRWYVRAVTRRSEVEPVVELHHSPPSPYLQPTPGSSRPSRHRLAGMVAWRLLAVVAGVALAFVLDDGGERVEVEASVGSPAFPTSVA